MMMDVLDSELLRDIAEDAEAAFWEAVVRRFPRATRGDSSGLGTIARAAIREWINYNVDIPQGYRFSLRRDVNRSPGVVARQGMTGTVTLVQDEDGLIVAKMDADSPIELVWDTGVVAFLDETIPLDSGP